MLAENQALSEVDQIAHLQPSPSQPQTCLLLAGCTLCCGAWQCRCILHLVWQYLYSLLARHPALQFTVALPVIPCGRAAWGSERFSVWPPGR